jgi:hypothetical protein
MANGRQMTLQRLAHLYKIVESVRSSELRFAEAKVIETQQDISAQLGMTYRVDATRRRALEHGDSLARRSAEAQSQLAERNCKMLKLVKSERDLLKEFATQSYRASRVVSEQMNQLLADSVLAQTGLQEKRSQAESDDRYLSRKHRTEKKAEKVRI